MDSGNSALMTYEPYGYRADYRDPRGIAEKKLNDDFYHTINRSAVIFNVHAISCFNPNFVDRSVPYEVKQRCVKFR